MALATSLKPFPRPEFFSPSPMPTGFASSAGRLIGLAHGVQARLGAKAAVVHDLSGSPHSPGHDDVALAHLEAADAHRFGQPIHHAFHGELRLIGAEAPECAADRIVGAHRNGLDVDSRN